MANPKKGKLIIKKTKPKYPGTLVTTNGNQLVAKTEARIADCGVYYPITPSTEQGEHFELSTTSGTLTVFGDHVKAIEAEGEHAAQGGAIAASVTGKRVANFTSGQGIVYGLEQYYPAPGKLSTMVLNVGARALTKHALNVHCGHDDFNAALDTGWIAIMAKDAQQAVDQSIILRRTTEQSLTPGMNIQDGFLTTHLERTFLNPESGLIREFLGHPDDIIDCPTKGQKELFGPTRKRVPKMYDLKQPILLGSVQNQEHYMTGVIARRTAFHEDILDILEESYQKFAKLTGRSYGFISEYNCKKADTVFLTLGCSAENIEPACDFIKEKYNDDIGVMHLNVIRPFPEAAIIKALKGKKNVIILERTDEPNSGSNPLARDVRTAFSKAIENSRTPCHSHLEAVNEDDLPRIFEGVYGLGSRDFRPEHVLGAYEYVREKTQRYDKKNASQGESFFYLGVNHPYAVISKDTPSLLPKSAISVRIHSIGGWGAITTGKNMAEILGNLSGVSRYAKHKNDQVVHISANPKYGSEKKGAPTNYFLVVARERVKVNCDLKHVDVVLCCDPKIFTHTNPLNGIRKGGSFVWEANIPENEVWERIPKFYRKEIIEKEIKVYTLDGFDVAKGNTKNESLQTRMQGNSFLGAFFRISGFLEDHGINEDEFLKVVHNQYIKKFGRFGDDVVASNLQVMKDGFERTKPLNYGKVEQRDNSSLRGEILLPCNPAPEVSLGSGCQTAPPIFQYENYKEQFLHGDMDNQEATALTATGFMPGGTGATISKFVSRIKTPVYNPYNCTQCMECISVCPDTALLNTSQDIDTVVEKVFSQYVSNDKDRDVLLQSSGDIVSTIRSTMNVDLAEKKEDLAKFDELVVAEVNKLETISEVSKQEVQKIIQQLPLGYGKARSIFQMLEKKTEGDGGLFSIFVSDLCKGCAECVEACGDHDALVMIDEDENLRGEHINAQEFYQTLPTTPRKYLGKFDPEDIENTRAAILHNHLMIQENYTSFASGDGSCAGCGEKSVLRGIVTMTEALMQPIFTYKAERLNKLADELEAQGLQKLEQLKSSSSNAYDHLKLSLIHLIMGFGADSYEETKKRIAQEFKGSDKDLIEGICLVLRTDAENHKKLKVSDGKFEGMSVMSMAASTGCNTVYGSTHPSNPHHYPWMNSLFQDGPTVGWLIAETFMMDHAKRSVIPERIGNSILEANKDFDFDDYEHFIHFNDKHMTDQEIRELPKVWIVGGDGALGDIGYQNLSKVTLQNRPNVNILMLDTQVYSNTGGQNSDSSIMPGGFDMNQFSKYHEGKLTERKEVALTLTSGHGSPYVAFVSMANAGKFFKSTLDGLLYRGTCFIQSFTSCQPEHGVADDVSAVQALKIRDSRGCPEFVFNPSRGETEQEAFDLKGNPRTTRDWNSKKDADKTSYDFTTAQWAATEGRFRKHFYKIKPEDQKESLDNILVRVTQLDVIHRYFLDPNHRAYIPVKGLYTDIVDDNGKRKRMGISRQLALFTIERRKNWRMIQSKGGLKNIDYLAQKELLKRYDQEKVSKEDLFSKGYELHETIVKELK